MYSCWRVTIISKILEEIIFGNVVLAKSLEGDAKMSMEKSETDSLYRIIIWGTGNTTKKAMNYLSDHIELIGFCDNAPNILQFMGFPILKLEEVNQISFDYIVICSIYAADIYAQLTEYGIPASSILIYDLTKSEQFFIYSLNPFEKKWLSVCSEEAAEVIISDISYHNDGIDADTFLRSAGKKAFNCALRGQDLFYDKKIAELLEKDGLLNCVRYWCIGLSYYSFEYDMSKASNAWEIIRYYPYIKEPHNLMQREWFNEYVNIRKKEISNWEIYYHIFGKRPKYEISYDSAKACAIADFNKNYPITRWENKKILQSFVQFLLNRNIKPIIVVMPAVQGYVENCPSKFKHNFYHDLQECLNGEDIQILDYFGSYYGAFDDWYHVSHFNKKGAERFTEKLIQDIKW